MPNGKVHTAAAVIPGICIAAYRARRQEPIHQLAEAIGGAIGGFGGGKFPDFIEPAISSWHRGTAHSWTGLAVASMAMTELEQWEEFCRRKAEHHRRVRVSIDQDPLEELLHLLAEYFWRIAAGVASGLGAGYISHLALDGLTPRSLPAI
jgi:membrane-bound metal-dependent hydrolase YbcI (DUF457 family)